MENNAPIQTGIDFMSNKESVELAINSKGIYTWTIKVKSDKLSDEDLNRLQEINEKMKRYNQYENN